MDEQDHLPISGCSVCKVADGDRTLQGKSHTTSSARILFNRFFYVWIFQPPVAEEPWHGTRLAQNYGRLCPQLDDLSKLTAKQRYEQDLEDCLHLSVYSGDVSTSEAFVWCLELVCCVFFIRR